MALLPVQASVNFNSSANPICLNPVFTNASIPNPAFLETANQVPALLPSLNSREITPLTQRNHPFELLESQKAALTEKDVRDQFIALSGKEEALIEFIKNNENLPLSNENKIYLILGIYSLGHRFSDSTVQFLIKTLRPTLDSQDMQNLFTQYEAKTLLPALDTISELFIPSDSPLSYDFLVLHLFVTRLKNEDFSKFWSVHNQHFMNVKLLEEYASLNGFNAYNLVLLKWLHSQGCPAHLFNMGYNTTPLQELLRKGDIEFAKKIAKEIPSEQIRMGNSFFQEEWKNCLSDSSPVDLSQFNPKTTLIGQNGCRAIVFTENGEVHSYASQDAKELSQQMTDAANLDSFAIFLNPGHASIAFEDFHAGFYPKGNQAKANMEIADAVREAWARQGGLLAHPEVGVATQIGGMMGMNAGISSLTHQQKSMTAVQAPFNSLAIANVNGFYETTPCMVIDDSAQAQVPDGLILTVYAPKDKVQAIREYVLQMNDRCESNNATYHVLANNCIDFVQQAFEASGTRADFRDSFHTMQYFRRLGVAQLHAMFHSNAPVTQQENTTAILPESIPDAVDRVSRQTVTAGILSIPGTLYAYLIAKGIPRAINAVPLAISRVQRVTAAVFGYTAIAMGAIMRGRILG